MKEITFIPLKGVHIKGVGNINFGESISAIKEILGSPEQIDNQFYYYNSELRIDFNEYNKVAFIECLATDNIKLIIYEKEALKLEGNELISLLKSKNKNKINDTEGKYAYYFFDINVGIYRESTPNSIYEMIHEMKNNGTYEDNKNWLEDDYKKSKYFNTIGIGIGIGIGNSGYYNE